MSGNHREVAAARQNCIYRRQQIGRNRAFHHETIAVDRKRDRYSYVMSAGWRGSNNEAPPASWQLSSAFNSLMAGSRVLGERLSSSSESEPTSRSRCRPNIGYWCTTPGCSLILMPSITRLWFDRLYVNQHEFPFGFLKYKVDDLLQCLEAKTRKAVSRLNGMDLPGWHRPREYRCGLRPQDCPPRAMTSRIAVV